MPSDIVLTLPHGPNNPRNSEGAFITLADGRIAFIYTHYYGESWHDDASARLCARYSSDGGKTWTAEDRVSLDNEGQRNIMSVSLLRLQDGRIALFYLRKNANDCKLLMRTSQDEAESWSEAQECIPPAGYYVVNNDRVIQLRSGRLVAPAGYHRYLNATDIDGRSLFQCYLSDDAGRTWRESSDWWALPVRGHSGLQEPGVIELKNGTLYGYCRTSVGRHYQLYSFDGGDTWTTPEPSPFVAPCSPLCLKRIPSTGDLLAIWNDHSLELRPIPWGDDARTSWTRSPLVSAISRDEGQTWTGKRLLETDSSHGYCYTAIHFVDDAVLLGYCCGGGVTSGVLQDLCIRRVTLDWLYNG